MGLSRRAAVDIISHTRSTAQWTGLETYSSSRACLCAVGSNGSSALAEHTVRVTEQHDRGDCGKTHVRSNIPQGW